MSSNPHDRAAAIARVVATKDFTDSVLSKTVTGKLLGDISAAQKLLQFTDAQQSSAAKIAPLMKSQLVAESALGALRPYFEQQRKVSDVFGKIAAVGAVDKALKGYGISPLAGTSLGRVSNTTEAAAWKVLQNNLNSVMRQALIMPTPVNDDCPSETAETLVDDDAIAEASAELVEEVVDALVEEAAKSDILDGTDLAPTTANTREQLRSVVIIGVVIIWPLLIALATVDPTVAVVTFPLALALAIALHFLLPPPGPR